jgi:hypothetical protein
MGISVPGLAFTNQGGWKIEDTTLLLKQINWLRWIKNKSNLLSKAKVESQTEKCSCIPTVCKALLSILEKRFLKTGEMAQQLRALDALADNPASIPRNFIFISVISVNSNILFWPSGIHYANTYMCLLTNMQAKYSYKQISNKS